MLSPLLQVIGLLAMLTTASPSKQTPPTTLDLNTAGVHELMALPGIGRKRAEDIVRRRKLHPYQKTWDLLRIRGIGRRTYARLKPYVRIGPPRAPSDDKR